MKNTNNLPIVALVGLTNSGKSSLFNWLTHSAKAITSTSPHTTRDFNRQQSFDKYGNFLVIDTAGYTKDKSELSIQAMHQLQKVLASAELIIYVVDSYIQINQPDLNLAKLLRNTDKKVILGLSKIDKIKNLPNNNYFRRLGFDKIVGFSAIHGTGINDLIEEINHNLPKTKLIKPNTNTSLNISLVGRINVGKSSLLNAIANEKLAITSNVRGTTRDTNEFNINYKKNNLIFIDTAGLRRPGKIAKAESIEFYSKLRTQKAITQSDICIMVLDATELITAQDLKLLGQIKDSKKGLIIAVTKWDLIKKDSTTMSSFAKKLRAKLQFVWWAPLIFVSSTKKQNINQLLEQILEINSRLDFKLSTSVLNNFLIEANSKNPPSAIKTKRPKTNYITQTAIRPPEFTIFATHPEYMHWSYTRYLENQLRQKYNLTGIPVTIVYKSKYNKRVKNK